MSFVRRQGGWMRGGYYDPTAAPLTPYGEDLYRRMDPRLAQNQWLHENVIVSPSANSVRIPVEGNFIPPVSSGYVHIKISTPSSLSLTGVSVILFDTVSNRETLHPMTVIGVPVAIIPGDREIFLVPFLSELIVSTVVVQVDVSSGEGSVDAEVIPAPIGGAY